VGLRRDQGIVLRGYPFGEADRIVVLLSPNNGKLRTVAKGVRRTKSRFGGRLEPFCHVDLLLYEGRNLDTITQVTLVEPFHALRNDLDAVLIAGSMVEVVDIVAQERESSVRLFLLLQRGLRALDGGNVSRDLATAFLLKAAGVVGVAPALESCAGCGRPDGLTRFSFAAGGALCEACRTAGAYALRPGVTAHLSLLAGADLGDLPDTDPGMQGEGLGVARRFLEYHLERGLGALAVLDG
jgi:DNA repair protein RecO (recombination protein O)